MLKILCIGTALLLGVGAVANGLMMLISPSNWYFAVPGVTTTGSFNQHFIRDIGIIFLFLGAAFLIGVRTSEYRVVAWGAPAIWLTGHALFHVWEVAVGICGPAALWRDFPAVTLPSILAILITFWAIGSAGSSATATQPQARPDTA